MNILLNTKLRRNLLIYCFTHPDEDYYVRELSSLIGADPGNLSRELRKMEEEGLFSSRIRGREKYYSLNKNYILFNEFKNIIFKTEGIEGSLRNIIAQFSEIENAFLYGSYVSGKEKRNSDIDLLIVGSPDRNLFTKRIRDLEQKLNREINFSIYSKEEFKKERKYRGSFLSILFKHRIINLKDKNYAA